MNYTDTETWANESLDMVVITEQNFQGQFTDKVVGPGAVVTITKAIRLLNEQRVADAINNPFRNGILTCKSGLDELEDFDDADKANLKTDKELIEILNQHWKKFEKTLEGIDSPFILTRMVGLLDNPEVSEHITENQSKKLRRRLADISTTPPVNDLDHNIGEVKPAMTPEHPVTRG